MSKSSVDDGAGSLDGPSDSPSDCTVGVEHAATTNVAVATKIAEKLRRVSALGCTTP